MEPFILKEHNRELRCYIDDEGVIQLRMTGNLSSDHLEDFQAWSESVKLAMRTAKAHDKNRVFCIIDITGGIDADREALSELVKLVRHNKDYATRTGVYGANYFTTSLMDIALKLAGRTNMKTFPNRAEAEHWVFTGEMRDSN